MAPIRRYLRITKYSVLQVRVYLDEPALAETWLLHPRDPVLPRIIEAVRPLVLPKLREENERAKNKRKKKGVKDVVVEDDFEVGVFLTDLSTRHSLLAKSKRFIERPRLKSNSGKMTGGLDGHANVPIDVDAASEAPAQLDRSRDSPVVLEESDDEGNMSMIPDMTADRVVAGNPRKGKRGGGEGGTGADEDDKKDKKKMRTMYEGFNIYGRILCLVVKRRGARTATGAQSGQQIMEQFVSTQAAGDPIFEDD